MGRRERYAKESIPGDLGHKIGDTLDKVQFHTLSDTTNHLEMPISLQHISLDCRRKQENREETPKAQGEELSNKPCFAHQYF
ncbi:hypothetical protein QTP86_020123 [Hemibagrus guttatus]|nr:hypothetical protein QTP86_020123 [Hemibagrus guttatus]